MLNWIQREKSSRQRIVFYGFALLTSITIPYLLGYFLQGSDSVFGGFLVNPIDGNSYLAKMEEGWLGSWSFTLPFTIEPGQGTFLFIFYLVLGHVSKWFGIPLIVTFHGVRILAVFFLFWVLVELTHLFVPQEDRFTKASALILFGSGLGWLIFLSGKLTSDFWVAEAYPFLSAYTNPHFPLGLGILLLCLLLTLEGVTWKRFCLIAVFSFLLAIIQPFGVVVGCMILAGKLVWSWAEKRAFEWKGILSFLIGGVPLILYQYWITLHDPELANWNVQNVTPAPILWDFVLSLSPALLLGFYGAWVLRRKTKPIEKILIVWLVGSVFLTYFPFNLQRRFMTGIYVPAALLGTIGIEKLSERIPRLGRNFLWKVILPISMLTNVLLVLAGIIGMMSHNSSLYMSRGEYTAYQWLNSNTQVDARILCSPDTGLRIPAYTGRRVIYGHPFETANADEMKAVVTAFFTENGSDNRSAIEEQNRVISEYEIDFIFVGPREIQLGVPAGLDRFQIVYHADGVTIYDVGQKS